MGVVLKWQWSTFSRSIHAQKLGGHNFKKEPHGNELTCFLCPVTRFTLIPKSLPNMGFTLVLKFSKKMGDDDFGHRCVWDDLRYPKRKCVLSFVHFAFGSSLGPLFRQQLGTLAYLWVWHPYSKKWCTICAVIHFNWKNVWGVHQLMLFLLLKHQNKWGLARSSNASSWESGSVGEWECGNTMAPDVEVRKMHTHWSISIWLVRPLWCLPNELEDVNGKSKQLWQ